MSVSPFDVVRGLMERGVPMTAAIGIAGNGMVESRLDPGINEIAPLVPGSRGGYGLMQWTGPRRRQFEAYAQERGTSFDDLNTQLDFLVHELNTTESRARDAIYGASNAEDAARLVSQRFLRPGIPHLDRRIEETRNVLAMVNENGLGGRGRRPDGPPQAQGQPTQPLQWQNALAGPMRPQGAPMGPQAAATPQMPRLDWRGSMNPQDFAIF